ncbi:endolytic transglycosylase MltG [Sulfurovum riftiae]|uniref:Endolytic murein transglycosylase n=1 Tax=Sulfurovum riftiae TaxID=1630136 RepID=A0A151CEC9_9BACT|nr:endolytic transglycosylase MltG [Sulfurovum riftiae]KYJ85839.1 hypothetical protein AS592_04410 [Sulfurovum riftiae]
MKQLIAQEYKRIARYIEIFIILVIIAFLYNAYSPTSPHKTFYLSGKNTKTTAEELEKYGYSVTIIDQLFMYMGEIPKKGWYHISEEKQSRFSFFSSLYRQEAKLMKVVVYAGETADELCKRLANDMKLDKGELLKEYQERSRFTEADIFAQSYILARSADAFAVMQYLFDRSAEILSAFEKEYFSQKPERSTIRILLTMASIIQKESNSLKEMPLISSVIYNRLEKKMKLQMDSTLNYGSYSHVIVTPERIKSDRTYFNTYKYKGLPPHPLGTVTIEALEAAMMPQKSDYLFFMLTPSGEHNFSVTYEEHLKNIRAFRLYQKKRKAQKEAECNATLKADANKTKI